MFEKILVPIDGSEHSLKALRVAVELAKKHASEKLVLINVYSAIVPTYGLASPRDFEVDAQMYQSMLDAARATSAQILTDGKNEAISQGLQKEIIETLSSEGHIVETIVGTAKEGKFDLIVLGHRGRSRFETLLGSISHGVTRHAPCPVLVVR